MGIDREVQNIRCDRELECSAGVEYAVWMSTCGIMAEDFGGFRGMRWILEVLQAGITLVGCSLLTEKKCFVRRNFPIETRRVGDFCF